MESSDEIERKNGDLDGPYHEPRDDRIFLFDGGIQLLAFDFVTKGMAELGISPNLARPLGAIMLFATLLYATPQTAVLGAILLTADLGGAIATHLRDTTPVLTHNILVIAMGAFGSFATKPFSAVVEQCPLRTQ